jgi:NAD(P)-dependent dehydrogenase (short-subunit alcohol dehydrogenase family)
MHRATLVTACALFAAAATAGGALGAASPWAGRTVLVTGANRGLGLEFARQLTAAGATVIGTARDPAAADELAALGARVEQLDVADPASVATLAGRLEGVGLDALVNNAGYFGHRGGVADLDPATARREYEVNALGPLRVTQALLPQLRQGTAKLVVNVSSGMGSLENAGSGGAAGYRASKAALNMLTVVLAAELKDEGFVCVAMSPGWVRTDMGGQGASLAPQESVRGMLAVLGGLGPRDTGRFLDHDGRGLPW